SPLPKGRTITIASASIRLGLLTEVGILGRAIANVQLRRFQSLVTHDFRIETFVQNRADDLGPLDGIGRFAAHSSWRFLQTDRLLVRSDACSALSLALN